MSWKRRFKSEKQKSTIQDCDWLMQINRSIFLKTFEMLYSARNKVIKLFDDYSTIVFEAKYKI